MRVEKDVRGQDIIIKLSGAIDTPVSPEFSSAVNELKEASFKRVIFDFGEVSYISSSRLGILLKAKKIANGKGCQVVLAHPKAEVIGIFDTVGFLPLFTIQK